MLVKADLENLQMLRLGTQKFELEKCNIGDEGVRSLTKGDWPNLAKIVVGTTYLISENNYMTLRGYVEFSGCDWQFPEVYLCQYDYSYTDSSIGLMHAISRSVRNLRISNCQNALSKDIKKLSKELGSY